MCGRLIAAWGGRPQRAQLTGRSSAPHGDRWANAAPRTNRRAQPGRPGFAASPPAAAVQPGRWPPLTPDGRRPSAAYHGGSSAGTSTHSVTRRGGSPRLDRERQKRKPREFPVRARHGSGGSGNRAFAAIPPQVQPAAPADRPPPFLGVRRRATAEVQCFLPPRPCRRPPSCPLPPVWRSPSCLRFCRRRGVLLSGRRRRLRSSEGTPASSRCTSRSCRSRPRTWFTGELREKREKRES